VLMN